MALLRTRSKRILFCAGSLFKIAHPDCQAVTPSSPFLSYPKIALVPVFPHPIVRVVLVIVAEVFMNRPAQMSFVEDDYMIQRFSAAAFRPTRSGLSQKASKGDLSSPTQSLPQAVKRWLALSRKLRPQPARPQALFGLHSGAVAHQYIGL